MCKVNLRSISDQIDDSRLVKELNKIDFNSIVDECIVAAENGYRSYEFTIMIKRGLCEEEFLYKVMKRFEELIDCNFTMGTIVGFGEHDVVYKVILKW